MRWRVRFYKYMRAHGYETKFVLGCMRRCRREGTSVTVLARMS